MQLSEIQTEVRNRLGEDTEDFFKTTQITYMINRAVKQFSREERWPWLQTVKTGDSITSGNSTLTLPNDIDFTRIYTIKLLKSGETSPYLLRRVNQYEGVELSTKRTTNSRPMYFWQQSAALSSGNMVATAQVTPAADGTYAVTYYYIRNPAALSSASDEPDIPEAYQEAVVAWATANLWLNEGSQAWSRKSQEQAAIYNEVVAQARREMYKLGEDESLVWGRVQDEHESLGDHVLPILPDEYGRRYGWGDF